MRIHRYSKTDKVTLMSMFTDLACSVPLGNTRPHSKDIVTKPQFVVDFKRDIYLLLYSDVVNEGLKNKQIK